MLKAGAARAVINPPLTIAHGGWGAQSHVTPSHIDSDFWSTALVLSDANSTTIVLDLDLCLLTNAQAYQIRSAAAVASGISEQQVRVSTTHTHAGPVVTNSSYNAGERVTAMYFEYVVEQSISAVLEAIKRQKAVTAHAEYGLCHAGKNRRQILQDGRVITGFNPSGATDPTVTVIRFDDDNGNSIANIIHYSCHPTTLGYTNQAASPDYPGVVKRFVEQTVGGICLFLQGAAGDIGPGPGGFLDRMDVVHDIGVALGCAASQALIEAKSKQYRYSYSSVVESGASLGIWNRELVPAKPEKLQNISEQLQLPIGSLQPPEELEQILNHYRDELKRLTDLQAPADEIRNYTYKFKRTNLALGRSRTFYGKAFATIEVHIIRLDDVVLISVPLEPFSATGKQIREQSPFRYTLFSGYTNGSNGYLPTADDFPQGGYEVENTAFASNASDLLVEQVISILNRIK